MEGWTPSGRGPAAPQCPGWAKPSVHVRVCARVLCSVLRRLRPVSPSDATCQAAHGKCPLSLSLSLVLSCSLCPDAAVLVLGLFP